MKVYEVECGAVITLTAQDMQKAAGVAKSSAGCSNASAIRRSSARWDRALSSDILSSVTIHARSYRKKRPDRSERPT